MRTVLLFMLLLFLAPSSKAQLLKGQWEGHFTDNGIKYPMILEFILNADTTYSVFSYSQNLGIPFLPKKDSAYVCKVSYRFTPPDEVYLEEIEVVSPSSATQDCFQKMNLKIVQQGGKLMLTGKWKTNSGRCHSSGKVTFTKINDG